MNNRLTTLSLIALLSLLGACSGDAGEKFVAPTDENAAEMDEPVVPYAEPPKDVVLPGNNNSEIVTTFDLYGNQLETRTFRDHQRLDKIAIRTLADGTKVGFAHGKNGEIRPLADDQIAVALKANPDDLANSAEIMEGTQEPKTETNLVVNSLPPVSEPVSSERTFSQRKLEPAISDADSQEHIAVTRNSTETKAAGMREQAEADRVRALQRAVGIGSTPFTPGPKKDKKPTAPEHTRLRVVKEL